MNRMLTSLALVVFVAGFAISASANTQSWIAATKDKTVRGIENGLFGMGGELYHNIEVRGKKGALPGWTLGVWDGIHHGLVRTLVGTYELATPFYHDQPILSDLDSVIKS